jgi:hypothetical protein
MTYLQWDDDAPNDEACNQNQADEINIVDMGGLRPWMRMVVVTMSMC